MSLRAFVALILYLLLWIPLFPVIFVYSLFRSQDRAALTGRLGISHHKPCFPDKAVWLHACSVGEVGCLTPLIEEFQRLGHAVIISTVTHTGFLLARDRWPGIHSFVLPFDPLIFFALAFKRPGLTRVYLLETEIWPGMIAGCVMAGIPVTLVNARISDNSFSRYHWTRSLIGPFLDLLSHVFAQSEIDRKRIRLIGRTKPVDLMPNIKFWSLRKPQLPDRKLFPSDRPYLVAGSTHEGEESVILDCFSALKKEFPDLCLLLAPRHLHRVERVFRLCIDHGLSPARRTQMSRSSEVIVLDTIGELAGFYLLPGCVFIGGSLIPHGGHNPLEAVAAGKTPVCGPHLFNFRDIVSRLIEHRMLHIAENPVMLKDLFRSQLSSPHDSALIRDFLQDVEAGRRETLEKLIQL
ncbi:MAG: glycosyltransferase N-terminal domain-containing protein [Candidatus Wallbacteria bacterium]|nr:glycosyltransferase N-terminal domain-containing protein [Candidatus Wallbacteria bacterium]